MPQGTMALQGTLPGAMDQAAQPARPAEPKIVSSQGVRSAAKRTRDKATEARARPTQVSFDPARMPEAEGDEGSAKVINREVLVANEQAQAIVRKAEKEAAALVRAAEEKAKAIRSTLLERAYRETLADWHNRFADLQTARDQMVDEIRPQLVELALWIATKILRRRIVMDPDVVMTMVEEALRSVRGPSPGRLVLSVHAEDRPSVEKVRDQLMARDPRWDIVIATDDRGMDRGGCRIESEFGEIDATVETQIRVIRQLLQQEVGTAKAGS
ncbi:MAG: FliH/SctL family protein [Acidobacteriota bacterium]